MAKKKIGLKSTLKKNQEEDLSLPTMKPLPKNQKDLQDMKEAVEILHQNERGGESVSSSPKAIINEEKAITPKAIEKPVEREIKETIVEKPVPQKTSNSPERQIKGKIKPEIVKLKRLTIDLDKKLHKLVKLHCDEIEVSMRAYIIALIETDIKKKRK